MKENQKDTMNSTGNSDTTGGCPSGHSGHASPPERATLLVRNVILVLSGKGGVGKSTVAVNLAYALSLRQYKTGLLDLDIHGPNVPKMLGIEDYELMSEGNRIVPVRVTEHLQVLSIAFLLKKRSDPVVWRGAMKAGVIRQFLDETDWGSLDYLVVDLPPGTGDEALTIAQIAPNIRGSIIVTTPQGVATLDSTKAITFSEMLEVSVLGVVENMSGFYCPHCHGTIDLFGSGGGNRIAEEHNVPYLGSIPLDQEMRIAGDEGRAYLSRISDSTSWNAMNGIVNSLIQKIE